MAQPAVPLRGYRVLRGTSAGPEYLSAFLSDGGEVRDDFAWTPDREASCLFGSREDASAIRELAVERESRCAAVVPAEL